MIIVRYIIPPILIILFGYLKKVIFQQKDFIRFTGNYKTWDDAVCDSDGYDHSEIIEKILNASRKVRDGLFAGEQDSVNFDHPIVNYDVLIGILNTCSNESINIVDFGGGLGSHYYQYRPLIYTKKCTWRVVEQEYIVKYGSNEFQNNELSFIDKIDDITDTDVFYSSCTLQYIKDPYLLLKKVLTKSFRVLIFNRLAFANIKKDRITIQHTNSTIYKATYPAWFLNEDKFLNYLKRYGYLLKHSYANNDNVKLEDNNCYYKGYIFLKA